MNHEEREKKDKCFSITEYEVEYDPYRGMITNDEHNPWIGCKFNRGDNTSSFLNELSCPLFHEWRREIDRLSFSKKQNKTSKSDARSLLIRNDDKTYRCQCDDNPFCLASLGGVMNDFLRKAGKSVSMSLNKPCEELVAMSEIRDNASDSASERNNLKIDSNIQHLKLKAGENQRESADDSLLIPISTQNVLTPSEEFFREVQFELQEIDFSDESCIYNKITREELSSIRKVGIIAKLPVHEFVEKSVLPFAKGAFTTCKYFSMLQEMNNKMIFLNPQLPNQLLMNGEMRIAMPPGIKNLGATCYLNTQLQCLARNIAFLEGIFAWQPSLSASRMDSVLLKLQQILAKLSFGAEAIISTEEFSEALGLQNDEMQDPNEFARLLFERMHEAFQQCSKTGNNRSNTLSELLPSLFQGAMTYETCCFICKRVTVRNEKFMDINLPIVQIPNLEVLAGQQLIKEAFSKAQCNANNTVQFCFERYMAAEKLTGENQYWCENCMQKQDAIRQVVLNDLPPILNLQLCRYVYDRQKQTKKKLSNRVLLSKVLNVKCKGNPGTTSYRLCAVMKHLGKSAYRGHYVAEVMDWQTGEWLEFDDESVSILDTYPGPSFLNTRKRDREETGKSPGKKGSQDAYNMYYVSEAFLGECAAGAYSRQKSEWKVTLKIEAERINKYNTLTGLCCDDARLAIRRKRRRRGLLSLLNSYFLSKTECVESECGNAFLADSIWIDGATLRGVFACSTDDDIDNLLNKLMEMKPYYCEHRMGLHPRVARRGKLLSRTLYTELITLLETEKKYLEEGQERKELEKPHKKYSSRGISPAQIKCHECSSSYVNYLRPKLESFRSLKMLYTELNPKLEGVICKEISGGHIYALSKRFVSQFRDSIAATIKSIDENFYGGLDEIKLPLFLQSSMALSESTPDVCVNSAILCKS